MMARAYNDIVSIYTPMGHLYWQEGDSIKQLNVLINFLGNPFSFDPQPGGSVSWTGVHGVCFSRVELHDRGDTPVYVSVPYKVPPDKFVNIAGDLNSAISYDAANKQLSVHTKTLNEAIAILTLATEIGNGHTSYFKATQLRTGDQMIDASKDDNLLQKMYQKLCRNIAEQRP